MDITSAMLIAFFTGFFMEMGAAAWRLSERTVPRIPVGTGVIVGIIVAAGAYGLSDRAALRNVGIITGSIVHKENSSIAPRRAPKKPPEDEDKPLFNWPP